MKNILIWVYLARNNRDSVTNLQNWYSIEKVYNCDSDAGLLNSMIGRRIHGTGNYRFI